MNELHDGYWFAIESDGPYAAHADIERAENGAWIGNLVFENPRLNVLTPPNEARGVLLLAWSDAGGQAFAEARMIAIHQDLVEFAEAVRHNQ